MATFMFRDIDVTLALQDSRFSSFYDNYYKLYDSQNILRIEVEAVKLKDEYQQQSGFNDLMLSYYEDRLRAMQNLDRRKGYPENYRTMLLEAESIWYNWYRRALVDDAAYQCMRQFVIRCKEMQEILLMGGDCDMDTRITGHCVEEFFNTHRKLHHKYNR